LTLISKTQYQTFETGEFTDVKERTCEETISLLNHFPWEEQRNHFKVSLTAPSVTIEGPDGSFLKIALYYNGKFILYFLNAQNQLYSHPIESMTLAIPYIQSYFDQPTPDLTTFKADHNREHPYKDHFNTQSFRYDVHTKHPLTLLWPQSLLLLLIIGIFLTNMANIETSLQVFLAILFLGLPALYLCLRLSVFVNHYRYCRDKIFILSQGSPVFYFGSASQPQQFAKKDIRQIIYYGNKGKSGNPEWLQRVEIYLASNKCIVLSTLPLSYDDMKKKFPGIPEKTQLEFLPFIPSSASTPF
jgi:hypothetical protein